jgi:hypothetical protein
LIQAVAAAVTKEFEGEVQQMYGDTDSVMFRLIGIRDVAAARVLANKIQQYINVGSKLLSGTLKMAFENISMPTAFIKPKTYVKVVYPPEENGKPPKMKKAAIDTRSFVKYTVETVDECLQMGMMRGASATEVEQYIRRRVQNLYLGRVDDIEKLKRSCNISKPLHEYEQECEQTLVAKQMLHDEMLVEPGDRVEFYMCDVQVTEGKKTQLAVSAHLLDKYTIKWDWYVEQLVNTLGRIVWPLISCDIAHLTDPETFDKVKSRPKPRPSTIRLEDSAFAKFASGEPRGGSGQKRLGTPGEGNNAAAKRINVATQQTLLGSERPKVVIPKRQVNRKDRLRAEKDKITPMDKFFKKPDAPPPGGSSSSSSSGSGAAK